MTEKTVSFYDEELYEKFRECIDMKLDQIDFYFVSGEVKLTFKKGEMKE